MSKRGEGHGGKDRGAKMFERFDADKNGSLSEEEFTVANEKMLKRMGHNKTHSE
jgi:Ca2+-binding EF-hand superfamily protein